jgi:hypothetical protein
MFKVTYLKEFTSGSLKDMTFEDTVFFKTLEGATNFTNTKEVKGAFGGSDYKIIWTYITKE